MPLVSIATSKPRRWSASTSSSSSCSSGSPPVHTTSLGPRAPGSCGPRGQVAATASAKASAVAKIPPPGPSVPTKSVSQNWQTALARCSSRPLHRLQRAKRQNTATRPVLAPSPCSVANTSLTTYDTVRGYPWR